MKIANPLYILILGDNANQNNRLIQRNEACQTAFMNMKDLCCSSPVLVFADFSKPFTMHMDASGIGLGAVLYQEFEVKEQVIGFVSQSLTKEESQYPMHMLEFLALK